MALNFGPNQTTPSIAVPFSRVGLIGVWPSGHELLAREFSGEYSVLKMGGRRIGLCSKFARGCSAPAIVCALLALVLNPMSARAESLQEALANAYLINPILNAERARLRATDEQVAIAKAGLRPTISGSADTSYSNQSSNRAARNVPDDLGTISVGPGGGISTDGTTHPRGYGVQFSQPLFEGFQNLNTIRQSKTIVQAGRESLRNIEQTILVDAATAYVNVVRDQAVVRLRVNDVEVLGEQLKATRDRFDVGEVTRTDVAQAQARESEAQATLAAAQAQLKTSRAAYQQVIGHPPENLITPQSILHLLPGTIDEAMTLGDGEHPLIPASVRQAPRGP